MIVTDIDGNPTYGHASDCARALNDAGIRGAQHLIWNWIRRGDLEKIGVYEGRPVYAMIDVYRVERATRRNGKRGRELTRMMGMTETLL